MDSRTVSNWLTGVCSSTPLPPEDSESVVWPPSPQTRAHRLRLQREAYRAGPSLPQVEQQRQQNHPSAAVRPDLDPPSHLSQIAKMPPRRSARKKVAPNPDDGLLQLRDVSAAIAEMDHHPKPQQDNGKGGSMDGPVDQSSDEVDDEDPDITPRRPPPSTNMTSRSMSIFSHQFPRPTSSTSIPPPKATSPTRYSRSTTGSSHARSKSPMKHSDDLVKLEKPVLWLNLSKHELQIRMQNYKSGTLFKSINGVLRKGYLPMELRGILDVELELDDSDDVLYTKRPVGPNTESQLHQAKFLQGAVFGSSSPSTQQDRGNKIDGLLSDFFHFQSLLSEFEALRTIVATTDDHIRYPRTEASWNEKVHRPMLDLAILHTPAVSIENVTRANIAKNFLPQTSADPISLTPDSKLIDYVMVLKPQQHGGGLNRQRLIHFIDQLEYRGFNQSPYYPLRIMPSGVFIETKVNNQRSNEGKAQLGMWLASWYSRVSTFPCLAEQDDILSPPVIPILLVEAKSWELYFAFDTVSQYEVCGPVEIGSTSNLDSAYRLLAVLRILAHWMATDFLKWVEDCLKQAGV
ncbi:hypothetical protein GGR58DRAFT_470610 [Xylaria digitata]|nr:hypothetical protein GGR58DRAFT_470610 [Xylaria digitata]